MPFLEVDPVANAVLLDGDARRELGAGQEAAREVLLERDALVDLNPEMPRPQAAGQSSRIGPMRWYMPRLKTSTESTSSNRSTIRPVSPSPSAWSTR